MADLEQPPLFLWQAPEGESWARVRDAAGVGLIFGIGGMRLPGTGAPLKIIFRAPLHTAIDIATDAFRGGNGIADEFELGVWRWHEVPLKLALLNMRAAFRRQPEYRRRVWRVADELNLLGNPQVKI